MARGDLASVIHICGKLGRTLDAIADTGADCDEVDWQVDLADARGRVGDRMTLKGDAALFWGFG